MIPFSVVKEEESWNLEIRVEKSFRENQAVPTKSTPIYQAELQNGKLY
jgi:hypothetical protein